MTELHTVLILAGGISHERDVSLRSGSRVADALAESGLTVELRDSDAKLLEQLTEARPDVVWPLLHGATGEDGSLYAMLRLLGIPYVGSTPSAARLAWDKPTAKTIVERSGVSTPPSITLPRDAFRDLGAENVLNRVAHALGIPLAVKPAQGGSAQGVSIVDDIELLPRAMVDAYSYSEVALIEQYVRGTEIAIGVVDTGEGPEALPAVEIEPRSGVYGFEARYNAGETRFYTPARLSEPVAARAAKAAVTAHTALGLGTLSRADFIVDAEGTPWFLECNVVPGLTETSLLPLAIKAAGHELGDMYRALAECAFRTQL